MVVQSSGVHVVYAVPFFSFPGSSLALPCSLSSPLGAQRVSVSHVGSTSFLDLQAALPWPHSQSTH